MTTYKMDTMGNFIVQENPTATNQIGDGIDIPATPNEAGRFSEYFATRSEVDYILERMGGFDIDDVINRLDSVEATIESVDLDGMMDKIDNMDIDRLDSLAERVDDLSDIDPYAVDRRMDNMDMDIGKLGHELQQVRDVLSGTLDVLKNVTEIMDKLNQKGVISEDTARLSQG